MKVIVIDDQPPEVQAMLAALYSRDPRSVEVHLEQVRKRGPEGFMAQYYVGYGHKSIGDCGSTTGYIENVSMLAAKAIQDTPLYNGQEASTRYLDMAKQEVLNPLGSEKGAQIQATWMHHYTQALVDLRPILEERFPCAPDEDHKVWQKAIKAKAFDIARCLLPAGCTTYVAWHFNLRQGHDHLLELEAHPLAEVRAVGVTLRDACRLKYASSFSHKVNLEQAAYIKASMNRFAYWFDYIPETFSWDASCFDDLQMSEAEQKLLESRPPRTELHQRFRQYGNINFKFRLDFASFRDLQRQRSCVQEMPLLTTRLGFHPWYLENLPPEYAQRIDTAKFLMNQLLADVDPTILQYYVPMGFMVPVKLSCPLPSAVYVAELRSGQTVHPTLRPEAQKMGSVLKEIIPEMALHVDFSGDVWSTKRGKQDIVKL